MDLAAIFGFGARRHSASIADTMARSSPASSAMLCGRRSGLGATARSVSSSSSVGHVTVRRARGRRPARVRPASGQHLIEDGADRVDVGAVVRRTDPASPPASRNRAGAAVGPVNPVCAASQNAGTLACPRAVIDTDSGLRPPCTKPRACAAAMASAIWIDVSTARAGSGAVRRSPAAATALAGTRRPGRPRPSCSSASNSVITLGCDSAVIERRLGDQFGACRGARPCKRGQQPHRHRAPQPGVPRSIQLAWPRRLQRLEQVVVGHHADGAGRAGSGRRGHVRSSSITVCSSSFASPICSTTRAMSSVGLPGVRALWQ